MRERWKVTFKVILKIICLFIQSHIYSVWWFLPDETTYQLLRLFEEWEKRDFYFNLFLILIFYSYTGKRERERNKLNKAFPERETDCDCCLWRWDLTLTSRIITAIITTSTTAFDPFSATKSLFFFLFLFRYYSHSYPPPILFPFCPSLHCHQSALNPYQSFTLFCRSSALPWL